MKIEWFYEFYVLAAHQPSYRTASHLPCLFLSNCQSLGLPYAWEWLGKGKWMGPQTRTHTHTHTHTHTRTIFPALPLSLKSLEFKWTGKRTAKRQSCINLPPHLRKGRKCTPLARVENWRRSGVCFEAGVTALWATQVEKGRHR